jgi:RNA polymerase sigma factor (sigma-70 family)
MYTDQELISGIIKNDDKALQSLYKTEYMSVEKLVYTFNNLTLEAEDVFQEGLTRLIMNVQSGRFRGESALATYLNSICRNICLKKLSKPQTDPLEVSTFHEWPDDDETFELLDFIGEVKKELGTKCRTIIDMRFRQSEAANPDPAMNRLMGFDEIAEALHITAMNARQRFKRCLDQLKEMVLTHPEYQSMIE